MSTLSEEVTGKENWCFFLHVKVHYCRTKDGKYKNIPQHGTRATLIALIK